MLDDLFSGLLEGLFEFLLEVVFEALGECLDFVRDAYERLRGRKQ